MTLKDLTPSEERGTAGFGVRLRRLMRERGYSGKQLAAKLGVSNSCVSRLLCQNRQPSISLLWRISAVFDIPAVELWEG